jgi:hypothetical protein
MLLAAATCHRRHLLNRTTILLISVLALVMTACGGEETSESAEESEAVPTVEPTPDPTPDPTPEPVESDAPDASADAGGNDSALLELLPDEIDGQARIDVDLAANPMFAAALEAQNIDVSDVEYVVSTYGTGEGVLVATAIRIPGMTDVQLQQLASLMGGMTDGQGSADPTTIGGKEVLAISATDVDQTGYMYFLDGAVIVVGGTSEDLAEEFFSQLP